MQKNVFERCVSAPAIEFLRGGVRGLVTLVLSRLIPESVKTKKEIEKK